MKRISGWILLLAVLVFAVVGLWPNHPSIVVPQQSSEKSPRLLVHLLDYLAVDYGGAVQNGAVVSDSEYKEQIEFVQTAVDLSHTLPDIQSAPEIQELIRKLSTLIQSKADSVEVASLARQIQSKVIELVRLPVAPASWPNLAAAKPLFEKTCSQCHGPEGGGDGPAAANLATKPVNFKDPVKMREMTPFQVFNTVRLGVPKTPMPSFTSYSDRDVWNLAFYVISLRYQKLHSGSNLEDTFKKAQVTLSMPSDEVLRTVATESDSTIEGRLDGKPDLKALALASLRLHSQSESPQLSLDFAHAQLEGALSDYGAGHFDTASKKALSAYVDGVEPIEPRLRANDPQAVFDLEQSMGLVRTAIHERKPVADVGLAIRKSQDALNLASGLLDERTASPALTFMLALGILVREGFEAALIIVALLGVIRVSGARNANRWVHAGWLLAVALGFVAWMFSGWLTNRGGLGRELMEGITGAITVLILLYLGFWLHSKTEITRWKNFIDVRVQSAVDQRNLLQLAFISFLAAFREAIETVLFLRAIWLEGGSDSKTALAGGVATAFVLILILGWLLLSFSARIPIRTMFNMSSLVMVALAVILTGKTLHAFQEVDIVSITLSPLNLHWDWLGLYPTRETLLAQLLILTLSLCLWMYGKRPLVRA